MTKPIILVKICYKPLYVIQGIKNTFDTFTAYNVRICIIIYMMSSVSDPKIQVMQLLAVN